MTHQALAADILLVPLGASFLEFDSTGRFLTWRFCARPESHCRRRAGHLARPNWMRQGMSRRQIAAVRQDGLAGSFDILWSANEFVRPDPYLANSRRCAAVGEGPGPGHAGPASGPPCPCRT
ncbi:hypothetical protein DPM13_15240 [Paracoccus mutanolyticus]|uniref:Uncharacterized protein n=1 Tax=Paracoccus mutanolyticus TaxID=1499308 RepID=A0ABN5M7J6_9RHOB|nr:hypothetical protein DPM13_15240 [Paracoccus mutanolyticus]